MSLRRLAVPALLAVVAPACELATHAFDYEIDTADAPPGLCDACPASADGLRHPPCPVFLPAPDLPRTFTFAARRASFGHAADFATAAPVLGYDLDCSDRPLGGRPVLCRPSSEEGWQALPEGIDDAFFQRVLEPIYAAEIQSRPFDLDAVVSSALEQGLYGLVVSVDRWNGALDDTDVEVTVRSSPGLAGGAAPAWNGADTWLTFPDVDADGTRPFYLESAPGYVSDGTLVVDARARGAAVYRFGPRGLSFELILADLSLTAGLTEGGLSRLTLSGTLDMPSAHDAALGLAGAVATCGDAPATAFVGALPPRIEGAADMPSDPTASPADPCDAISFAWAFDAEPAKIGGAAPPEAAGPACP